MTITFFTSVKVLISGVPLGGKIKPKPCLDIKEKQGLYHITLK